MVPWEESEEGGLVFRVIAGGRSKFYVVQRACHCSGYFRWSIEDASVQRRVVWVQAVESHSCAVLDCNIGGGVGVEPAAVNLVGGELVVSALDGKC